jgi:hypothetical protein
MVEVRDHHMVRWTMVILDSMELVELMIKWTDVVTLMDVMMVRYPKTNYDGTMMRILVVLMMTMMMWMKLVRE